MDLSIGIKGQKKFVNYDHLDDKARKAKNLEDIIQEAREKPIEENEHFPKTTHLARKLINTDPGLNFMNSKKKKLIKLYSQEPRALPTKEIKPLKFSKLDRFANNIEINFAGAGNSQLKSLEAFDQADADVGYWHLKKFIRFYKKCPHFIQFRKIKN
jgi:hypothetical protein